MVIAVGEINIIPATFFDMCDIVAELGVKEGWRW